MLSESSLAGEFVVVETDAIGMLGSHRVLERSRFLGYRIGSIVVSGGEPLPRAV
jgi:pyruvate-formate lyase-activating enzyme